MYMSLSVGIIFYHRVSDAGGIDTTEQKAQYDAACKKLLAEKIILAWIMKYTMKEFADYDVRGIVEYYIIGEPKIANEKVMPDDYQYRGSE